MELDRAIVIGVGAGSALMFVGTLLALPYVVARAPRDFFTRAEAAPGPLAMRVVRNLLAALLVVAGLAMLVLPGQGLLTILFGVALADVPGKRALVKRIAQREGLWRALNALRRKLGCPEFERPR
jgi:Putative transmembrane protein (PGPGW)